ncbi:MAG: CBS domain-containing protein [Candidatus Micrarchaeia archaeon]
MKVSEIMKTRFLYFDGDESLLGAARKLFAKNRRDVPVLYQGKFIGMLTTSDIAEAMVRGGITENSRQELIAKLGGEPIRKHIKRALLGPSGLDPEKEINEVFIFLAKSDVECIPAIDRRRRLMGVVFASDARKIMFRILSQGSPQENAPKKRSAPRRGGVDTAIDQIEQFVRQKGTVSSEEVAVQFKLPLSTVEDYAVSLEKYRLLKIEYTMFGKMTLKRPE